MYKKILTGNTLNEVNFMKLKPFVFPVLYISLIFMLVVGLYFTTKNMSNDMIESLEDVDYVSNVILDDIIPVVNVDTIVSNPYYGTNVTIARYYYNLEDDVDRQKESITSRGS